MNTHLLLAITAVFMNTRSQENDAEEEEDDGDQPTSSDVDILNALTGIPLPEDELLYAVPVVAPYTTLMPYKYLIVRDISWMIITVFPLS